MQAVSIFNRFSQRITSLDKLRAVGGSHVFGAPWTLTSLLSTSIKRFERMLPATSTATHSPLYSSMTSHTSIAAHWEAAKNQMCCTPDDTYPRKVVNEGEPVAVLVRFSYARTLGTTYRRNADRALTFIRTRGSIPLRRIAPRGAVMTALQGSFYAGGSTLFIHRQRKPVLANCSSSASVAPAGSCRGLPLFAVTRPNAEPQHA
jgi:hypothetical protein